MSIVLIVFGVFFLLAGVNNWRDSREHFKRGQKTEASIVGLRETTIQDSETLKWVKAYQAIYAYLDNDGNEHRLRGNRISTTKNSFTIGARKTVYFNPENPIEVYDTPVKVFSGLTFALVAGAGMILFGIAALVLDWDL